jgi:hypothetical protein
VGGFSVDLIAQGAIRSSVHVDVNKPFRFHGEFYIPAKAIQMVNKPDQLLCSLQPDDKGVIKVTELAHRFVSSLCQGHLLIVSLKKLARTREGVGPTASPSVCPPTDICLFRHKLQYYSFHKNRDAVI